MEMMKSSNELGQKRFETDDLTDEARSRLKWRLGILISVGILSMIIGIVLIVTPAGEALGNINNAIPELLVRNLQITFTFIAGIITVLVGIAGSGKIIKVTIYEKGLIFRCLNNITRTIMFDDIQRITYGSGKIKVFCTTSRYALYIFKGKYILNIEKLYEQLEIALNLHQDMKNSTNHVKVHRAETVVRKLKIGERMRYSIVVSIYFYAATALSLLIVTNFNPSIGILLLPFFVIVPYLGLKFFRIKRPVNDAGAEFYMFLWSLVVIAIANFNTHTYIPGNRFLNLLLAALPVIVLGLILGLAVYMNVTKMSVAEVFTVLAPYFGRLLSKKARLRWKEFLKIMSILQMDCDPQKFMTEANEFLLRNDLLFQERFFLQHNIAYAHGVMGDYDEAIRLTEEFIQIFGTHKRLKLYLKQAYLYDLLVQWLLRKGEAREAQEFARLRDAHADKITDDFFPPSQGYFAIIEGSFEKALKFYEQRRNMYKEKNVIMTRLFDVTDQFEMALIYEKLGELEKQKEALLFVVQYGRDIKVAQIAREKLADMEIEVPSVETVAAVMESPVIQRPKAKLRNILSFSLMLLVIAGFWIFTMRVPQSTTEPPDPPTTHVPELPEIVFTPTHTLTIERHMGISEEAFRYAIEEDADIEYAAVNAVIEDLLIGLYEYAGIEFITNDTFLFTETGFEMAFLVYETKLDETHEDFMRIIIDVIFVWETED